MRALALAAVIVVTPALAEPRVVYRKAPTVAQRMVQCDTHDKIVEVLSKRFGETRVAHALSGTP
jgi:hypothetical protein